MFSNIQQNPTPIPLIDFSKFLNGTGAQRHAVAKEMVEAFKVVGFVYLTRTGLCEGKRREELFSTVERFFDLPNHVKDSLAWKDPRANRGYVSQGRERVTQVTDASEVAKLREILPDFKESMEIGRDDDPDWQNQWPCENDLPGFKKEALDLFQACNELHLEVLHSLALGLNLPEQLFDNKCDKHAHTLRLLNYPSIELERFESGGSRADAHTDYGTITLLFQDSVGGLEVEDPLTQQFTPVQPIDDTIVVNVGDLMSRWTNGILKSTLHRVVLPTGLSPGSGPLAPRRQSVAFFGHPDPETWVKALPGTGVSQDQGIRAGEYLMSRIAATYSVDVVQ